jgi:hypothetical protein
MTIVEPNGRRAYVFLARALAAENAPLEAIEEALHKRAAVTPDGAMRSEATMENSLALALLTGDLLAAEAAARRGMALVEGAQLESEHAPPLEVLLDVLEERGEPERALAEGEAYERHAAAWTGDAPFGAHVRIVFLRSELGRIDLPALNATLAALHEKQARGGVPFCWTSEEGLFVSGAEQASRVLAEVPDSGGWRTSVLPLRRRAGRDQRVVHLFHGEAQAPCARERGACDLEDGLVRRGIGRVRRGRLCRRMQDGVDHQRHRRKGTRRWTCRQEGRCGRRRRQDSPGDQRGSRFLRERLGERGILRKDRAREQLHLGVGGK